MMLTDNSKRKVLSIVLDFVNAHDWDYYDDFHHQVVDVYSNLFDSLIRKPTIGEFLVANKKVKTSFFRRNTITRDEFFRGVFQIIDSIDFETKFDNMTAVPIGQTPTTNEEYITNQFREFEKKLQKIVENNQTISENIENIWKELVIQTGKMAGIGGDIESVRNVISDLVMTLQIEGKKKKGIMNRIQGLTKDVAINTIANLISDIIIIALRKNM